MDIKQLILESDTKSVNLYLRRQELEMTKQQIQLEIMKVENQLVKADGEKELLVKLQQMKDTEDGK